MTPANPFIEEDLQKFAELIIKECAEDIVQPYMSRHKEDHELTARIKQHFGVK